MPSRWRACTCGLCWVALGGCNALWGLGDLQYDGAAAGGLSGGSAAGAAGAGAGGSAGAGGAEGGAGGVAKPCDYTFECSGADGACRTALCENGYCAWSYTAAGDPCSGSAGWCDGAGVCLDCGNGSPPKTEAACPAVCNGGCNGTICVVECTSAVPCWHELLVCPPGYLCEVNCEGADACADIQGVACATQGCRVRCDGPTACGFTLFCSVGPCELACASPDACGNVTVECGPNACVATCPENGLSPAVLCGFSCNCVTC